MGDLERLILDGDSGTLTYEQARELSSSKDPRVREAVAAHPEVNPEILYFLAADAEPQVRRQAAINLSTPHQAHLKLAEDDDGQVRTGLAEKIARLAPDLDADDQDKLRRATYETLDILARDQLTRVRQILSETLKDVANAPPELIRSLARDTSLEVASPVLEFSPVLTDEDLLEIIESGPVKGAVGAISRRSSVSESISDAVVGSDDTDAIAELLSNKSAQIREETLDSLIEQAENIELWQAPLVGRPQLPSRAAGRLAHFVADNLLDVLQARTDLDAETLEAVKSVVHRRVSGEQENGQPDGDAGPPKDEQPGFLEEDLPIPLAERLYEAKKLDAKVLSNAVQFNDFGLVLAALTVRGNVTVDVVKKIFSGGNPKGIVALTWKADLLPDLAVLLQQRVARIPPPDILNPNSDGAFPLTEDEMNWQLEFFGDPSFKELP